ncbi:MAG: type VI secretion system membrane subunit TssM, partial [Rhizobacter sp.]
MNASTSLRRIRTVLALAGVAAGAALLWFVGPLVAVAGVMPLAGEPARWAAVAALLGVVLAHGAWRQLRSSRDNRRLMEGLLARGDADAPPSNSPGAKEVALIGRRFEQAVALLRRSRIGARKGAWWLGALSGRPYVYQLPWYIIIGAPGAGKTTALVNSGLEFPLADAVGEKVVRGIGGTRHCDWWFSTQAVLIDTAGRYTTHDSDRVADRTAWIGFLDLLARYRPSRPINGVLLTVSVSDLLAATPEQRAAHAAQLAGRIEELHERLSIAFPVYVMVTKSDLLAGFMEFFADFDKDERAQVWGITFPYEPDTSPDGPLLRMASDFAALEKRLNDCLMDRLHGERDRERRAALYAFPQQWRVLRQTLFDFLQAMIGGLRPELRACVRGVYFTSATQEGTPMDRALGGLARALGLASRILPPARPSGKA